MSFSTWECSLAFKWSPFLWDMQPICPGSTSFQVAAKVNKPEKITLQTFANIFPTSQSTGPLSKSSSLTGSASVSKPGISRHCQGAVLVPGMCLAQASCCFPRQQLQVTGCSQGPIGYDPSAKNTKKSLDASLDEICYVIWLHSQKTVKGIVYLTIKMTVIYLEGPRNLFLKQISMYQESSKKRKHLMAQTAGRKK